MDAQPSLRRLLRTVPGEARMVIALVAAIGVGLLALVGAMFYMEQAHLAGATRVTAPGAQVGTLADGPLGVGSGTGLAADGRGGWLVADTEGHRIRHIDASGRVTVLAGDGQPGLVDGPNAQARFHAPRGLVRAPSGVVYVADTGNHAIRRIGLDGRVTTLAGDGQSGNADGEGATARFDHPTAIAFDGGALAVVDARHGRLRRIQVPAW